ncbi:MAG TPA: hypothetical protein VJ255_12985 [Candidatus Acidoferrum sp.]|nr:hypothetical protein [Candidatus Acidoferrum sp.]
MGRLRLQVKPLSLTTLLPTRPACSLETKSEIVVAVSSTVKLPANPTSTPIFLAAFGPDDRKLCEHAAALLGKIQREIQS